MGSFYLAGQTGSDTNDGLTADTPKKTWSGLLAAHTPQDGDIFYWNEQVRSATTYAWAQSGGAAYVIFSDVTAVQLIAGSTASMRGDTVLVQTGWTASGNAWTLTLTGGPAVQPDAAVARWDEQITAAGQHYGHQIPDSAANCQAATGDLGRWNYNTTTKVLTWYVPGGLNPNTCGFPLRVCWTPAAATTTAAIQFSGGANNIIRGGKAELYPSQSGAGQNAWGQIFLSSPGSIALDFDTYDCGAHGVGAYGGASSASGCEHIRCDVWSGRAGGGGAFISFTAAAYTMTGRYTGCIAYVYEFLGDDAARRLDGTAAMDAFSGDVFYAHSTAGTPITLMQWTNCEVHFLQDPGIAVKAFNIANKPATSDPDDFETYAGQADRCIVTGAGTFHYTEQPPAFRRCRLEQTRQLHQGGGGTRGAWTLWTGAGTGYFYFEACEFRNNLANTTGHTRAMTVNSNSNTSYAVLVNNSFLDTAGSAADMAYFLDYVSADANLYRGAGNVFAHTVNITTSALCWQDASTSAANHGFGDGAYYNIDNATGRYSQNAAINSAAEFIANVDPNGHVLTEPPYPAAPVTLDISGASPLWTLRRDTSDPVPLSGITSSYVGAIGAFQPHNPAIDSARGGLGLGIGLGLD